jgi:hypothetical protein
MPGLQQALVAQGIARLAPDEKDGSSNLPEGAMAGD